MRILVVDNLQELEKSELVVFGSGSTCKEFLNFLYRQGIRPRGITVLNSFDEGVLICAFGQIHVTKMTSNTSVSGVLVIASCQWNEILEAWRDVIPKEYYLLSNELMHLANAIGQMGPFRLNKELSEEKKSTLTSIRNAFIDSRSRELFELAFQLRIGLSEKIFYREILHKFVQANEGKTKYSSLFNLRDFDYVIDGGIYDGNEIIELTGLLRPNGEYHGFDPNLQNISIDVRALTKRDSRIKLYERALWNSETFLPFNYENGASSSLRINEESAGQKKRLVETTVLSNHFKGIHGKTCLIKLDIEGAELAALRGGLSFFKNNRVMFAVSMYHKSTDLIEIPEFLLSLDKKFKFRIGISNPTFIDWVLYTS